MSQPTEPAKPAEEEQPARRSSRITRNTRPLTKEEIAYLEGCTDESDAEEMDVESSSEEEEEEGEDDAKPLAKRRKVK